MQQVQLSEQLYREAQRRASEAGYTTVDEFIAEIVSHELHDDENLDHLFTTERLAHIDKAQADIEVGNFFTTEQAEAELTQRRAEWMRKHPG